MNAKKKTLGRGMSALIRKNPNLKSENAIDKKSAAKAAPSPENEGKPLSLPMAQIRMNPQNPRRHFDVGLLEELAQSIKQHGLIQPILVRPSGDAYELVAGERRYRASKLAGLKNIPVFVKEMGDQQQFEVALIENLQRSDLSPMEEAKGYHDLATRFELTQEDIAKRVGKQRSTVANMMRLVSLAPQSAQLLDQGKISMGHARALLAVDQTRAQENLALSIAKNQLSVRQTEQKIRALKAPASAKSTKANAKTQEKLSPNLRDALERCQKKLGCKVMLQGNGASGELKIAYSSAEELSRVVNQILS